ncbi:MAG: hypothetical protein M5U28_52010 [Sandaracinaceae bacterium]|nr:hypothetical protein [Sandaracinaceae bacterium]
MTTTRPLASTARVKLSPTLVGPVVRKVALRGSKISGRVPARPTTITRPSAMRATRW